MKRRITKLIVGGVRLMLLPLTAIVFVGEVLLAGIEAFIELAALWVRDKEDE